MKETLQIKLTNGSTLELQINREEESWYMIAVFSIMETCPHLTIQAASMILDKAAKKKGVPGSLLKRRELRTQAKSAGVF